METREEQEMDVNEIIESIEEMKLELEEDTRRIEVNLTRYDRKKEKTINGILDNGREPNLSVTERS